MELDAGAHRLEIDHWQHGGSSGLYLAWAPAGGDSPVPLGPDRLFAEDPGALAYRMLAAAPALGMLVLLIWGVGATWEKYVTGAYNPTVVEFPSWIVLLCIPVGSLILALRFLRHTIEFAAGVRSDQASFETEIG